MQNNQSVVREFGGNRAISNVRDLNDKTVKDYKSDDNLNSLFEGRNKLHEWS